MVTAPSHLRSPGSSTQPSTQLLQPSPEPQGSAVAGPHHIPPAGATTSVLQAQSRRAAAKWAALRAHAAGMAQDTAHAVQIAGQAAWYGWQNAPYWYTEDSYEALQLSASLSLPVQVIGSMVAHDWEQGLGPLLKNTTLGVLKNTVATAFIHPHSFIGMLDHPYSEWHKRITNCPYGKWLLYNVVLGTLSTVLPQPGSWIGLAVSGATLYLKGQVPIGRRDAITAGFGMAAAAASWGAGLGARATIEVARLAVWANIMSRAWLEPHAPRMAYLAQLAAWQRSAPPDEREERVTWAIEFKKCLCEAAVGIFPVTFSIASKTLTELPPVLPCIRSSSSDREPEPPPTLQIECPKLKALPCRLPYLGYARLELKNCSAMLDNAPYSFKALTNNPPKILEIYDDHRQNMPKLPRSIASVALMMPKLKHIEISAAHPPQSLVLVDCYEMKFGHELVISNSQDCREFLQVAPRISEWENAGGPEEENARIGVAMGLRNKLRNEVTRNWPEECNIANQYITTLPWLPTLFAGQAHMRICCPKLTALPHAAGMWWGQENLHLILEHCDALAEQAGSVPAGPTSVHITGSNARKVPALSGPVKSLRVSKSPFIVGMDEAITELHDLVKLHITGTNALVEEPNLRRPNKLREVEISHCPGLKRLTGLQHCQQVIRWQLGHNHNLRQLQLPNPSLAYLLDLRGCKSLSESVVEDNIARCEVLRTLRLANTLLVRTPDVRKLRQLRLLDMRDVPITSLGKGLDTLPAGCKVILYTAHLPSTERRKLEELQHAQSELPAAQQVYFELEFAKQTLQI
jgi:hypothetical protein